MHAWLCTRREKILYYNKVRYRTIQSFFLIRLFRFIEFEHQTKTIVLLSLDLEHTDTYHPIVKMCER